MTFLKHSITIIAFVLLVIVTQSTSDYEGVSWDEKKQLWKVEVFFNGKKSKLYFENKLDAAKEINQVCGYMKIPLKNLELLDIPNQQTKQQTSKHKGVSWNKRSGHWHAYLQPNSRTQTFGGSFKNELDAAKRVNQLYEELKIPPPNPGIVGIPNQRLPVKVKTSQYKGVSWQKKGCKWFAHLCLKGEQKHGGSFINEMDAAKRVNQLCKQFGIPLQNLGIAAIPTQPQSTKEKTSQYEGVNWNKTNRKWFARLSSKGKIQKYGGCFNDELDAAKRVNQMCEEMKIPLRNSGISAIPTQQCQKKEKISQYEGVSWHSQRYKWYARLRLKYQIPKYGGCFNSELDAARRVNQMCEEMKIPLRNSGISTIPTQRRQKKQEKPQYKGVYWNKRSLKWYAYAYVHSNARKQKFGGSFKNQLDAANRTNQLCEELGIPLQNPGISEISTQQFQSKTLLNYDAIKSEFEDFIKILDGNNDPTALPIKETLFAAINYGEETRMTEIDLQTKNGESALSMAAKHGFSNIVKFLISKGANKEHFTYKNHTPLSLAVSHNYLKVVEVLLEKWISPNSHEEPYLHLLPIFNVKSREIAQLLVDNDAVTGGLYNNKNQSPLTVACQNGFLDVVEFFLDDGLDINHLDTDNKTPLFYALTNKHHDVANLLISKGAQK